MDAQKFASYGTANFGFSSDDYNGVLFNTVFTKSNIYYSNSAQNRVVAIPPFVCTQNFYLLITLGFNYKSQGAFTYIKPVFQ